VSWMGFPLRGINLYTWPPQVDVETADSQHHLLHSIFIDRSDHANLQMCKIIANLYLLEDLLKEVICKKN
jgi:hypothetical protein